MHLSLRWLTGILLSLSVVFAAPLALADVKREGTWPEKDKTVSLDLKGVPRNEAVRRIAEEAGLSLVVSGVGEDKVDLRIKDQPAARVLELVLDDGAYVATREGDLVKIKRTESAPTAVATPVPPAPPPVAAPASADKSDDKPEKKKHGRRRGERGEDRTVFGSSLRIEANETVNDATVFGGNLEVLGHVTGDLTVFGGTAELAPGAHVDGDVSVLGGKLKLADGSIVDHDVSVLGGSVERAPGSKVGGDVSQHSDSGDSSDAATSIHLGTPSASGALGVFRTVGRKLASMSMLFVFGVVLLALGSARMESMRVEIAARPMRTFALGVVAFFGAIVATIVLCVTIIGIPLALVGIFLAVLGGYAGATAALTTFGAAVLGHRTQSPYAHLAFGCVALFVVCLIPFIGDIVAMIVGALGLGVLLATRGAGFMASKRSGIGGPYRSEA